MMNKSGRLLGNDTPDPQFLWDFKQARQTWRAGEGVKYEENITF